LATHAGPTAHTLPWLDRLSAVRYPPPDVLLVEGHADTRELYELWLTQRAFAVTPTASGDVALAAARAQAPDVIVVELMVPYGGVPLVRALRAEAGCRDTIIIVLTTQADTALREHALEAGADFYLVKPCGVLRLGEVMAIASRDRSRLVAPDTYGAKPSSARIRQVVRRLRAIRERLAPDTPPPSAPPGNLH
jgi:DNA-binding response OmpR family regulator